MNGAKLKADFIGIEQQAKDSLRESQERETPVIANKRNGVGRLGAGLQAVLKDTGLKTLAAAEMLRANKQLGQKSIG
jgi:hypothetical protein